MGRGCKYLVINHRLCLIYMVPKLNKFVGRQLLQVTSSCDLLQPFDKILFLTLCKRRGHENLDTENRTSKGHFLAWTQTFLNCTREEFKKISHHITWITDRSLKEEVPRLSIITENSHWALESLDMPVDCYLYTWTPDAPDAPKGINKAKQRDLHLGKITTT